MRRILQGLTLTTLILLTLSRKIYMFMGQVHHSMDVFKVYVYPDYTFEHSLIFKRDFECLEARHCLFDAEPKKMKYMGQELTYYDAYTQMNLLPQAFANPAHFRYVIDDSVDNMSSVVGFSKDSEFLKYLALQNYEKDRNLIFKLDWEHNMIIKGAIIKSDKLPIDIDMSGTLVMYNQPSMKTEKLKVCYTNALDLVDNTPSIFGVKKSEFNSWRNFISDSMQIAEDKGSSLMLKVTLFLFDVKGSSIGSIDFKADEFIGDRGQLLVKPFSNAFDGGKGCDLYFGSVLLRKHNFEYFYRETPNGNFDLTFSYDGYHGLKLDSRLREKSHFEMDLVWCVAMFLMAGFFVYHGLLKKKESSLGDFDEDFIDHEDGMSDVYELSDFKRKV